MLMKTLPLIATTSLILTNTLWADKNALSSIRPAVAPAATAIVAGTPLPTGMSITPNAAPGSSVITLNPGLAGQPNYVAGQPVSTVTSPDGNTLLLLTSG